MILVNDKCELLYIIFKIMSICMHFLTLVSIEIFEFCIIYFCSTYVNFHNFKGKFTTICCPYNMLSQFKIVLALVASPINNSTSVGLKYFGSVALLFIYI